MRFFEVKVKYDKMLETGAVKTVTETYALDALSFTEAEAKITDKMRPFIQGSFEVTAEKIAPYTNLIRGDHDLTTRSSTPSRPSTRLPVRSRRSTSRPSSSTPITSTRRK